MTRVKKLQTIVAYPVVKQRTKVGSMNQQGNEIHWGLIKREELYHVVVKVLWWCNMYRKLNFPSI